jgi:orotidine-5'-phosphate decarboxylase
MTESFPVRLTRAIEEKQSCLVVGLDPVIDRLPGEIQGQFGGYVAMDSDGVEIHPAKAAGSLALFCTEVIEAVAPFAAAVKPNTGFFERFGPAGFDALVHVCRSAQKAGLLVILDAKRGDLSSTAVAYAEGLLGNTRDTPGAHADAITVQPYMGWDCIRPFAEVARQHGKGLFVLVRTSNPSAADFQELEVDGEPVYLHVARKVKEWGLEDVDDSGLSLIGAVVGATAPEQAEKVRRILDNCFFLVPGYGAQGAGADEIRPHFLTGGKGVVVNASRSILYAFEKRPDVDWRQAVADAARAARDELEGIRTG